MYEQPASFISLFSGAGGLDCGLEAAGWRPLTQIECAPNAAATLRQTAVRRTSHLGLATEVAEARIEDIDPKALRMQLGLAVGELDLLAGGPPCQPFTTHGRRRSIQDRRAETVWPSYLNYVEEFSPRALVIENVDGLLSAALQHRALVDRGPKAAPLRSEERKGSFLQWFIQELSSRGFTVSWGVAEAADYGVAQFRQRAILIGVRSEEPCFIPEPTFGNRPETPFRTLKDALSGVDSIGAVQPLSQFKQSVYRQIPPGGNWRDLSPEMQQATMGRAHFAEGGKSGWWRRLSWDSPAPTILGMPDHSSTALVHPDELRCLSVNECAAVQSFPPDYIFAGTSRSQYQQIGDAVPPLLGQAVGSAVRSFLDGVRTGEPPEAAWRKRSSNRRIGTHGWTARTASGQIRYRLNSKVRDDHVWSDVVKVHPLDDGVGAS